MKSKCPTDGQSQLQLAEALPFSVSLVHWSWFSDAVVSMSCYDFCSTRLRLENVLFPPPNKAAPPEKNNVCTFLNPHKKGSK